MNNAQSLLTIGALVILSLASIGFHSAALENSTLQIENKVALTAFSLADDLIEEIKVRSFDEATINFPTTNTKSLTLPMSLGPETGETYPYFDDVDDFNNYEKKISAPHAENYNVTCKIFYVNGNYPDYPSLSQTFYKKAKITVTSPYMKNPVSLGFIFTHK